MLLAALGMALSIATWSHGKSTSDPWFWVRTFVLPLMSAGFVFGLRWLFYGQQVSLHEADEETDAADRAKAIRFGQEPLAVLGLAYLTAMGSGNVGARIAGCERALRSQQSPTTGITLRRTHLDILDGTDGFARFQLCLFEVMRGVHSVIQRVPSNMLLDVYLQVPETLSGEEVQEAWRACTKAIGITLAEPLRLTKEDGLMAIDEWLDIHGGPSLERFALFIAVQASGDASPNDSEAAVAVLMAWSPLAERMHLDVIAKLHRPVDVQEELTVDEVSKSLLWGNTEAREVLDMWQAGLSEGDDDVLSKAASDLELALVEADEPTGFHDIDAALGNTGEAASWLAIALAAEQASEAGTPQLVCTRQGTIRMAMVRPAEQTNQAEQTG
ncbi:hypothetical protein M3I53_08855 [Paraburkholderia sp. CNPSo 3272]|uniref:hypothetical protein n=1 Tax=Paraburkholderia sp. CNPSo 3272 TaxID=2940931 RepID=UPI0020B71625|nr:hypothetical protein [Paraburkholderia sp. CNPSo 3272]MCP3723241.1 hypothetical protein [Paraburkholderia sp. CNPSo 3272]